jgi:hypothetical protein
MLRSDYGARHGTKLINWGHKRHETNRINEVPEPQDYDMWHMFNGRQKSAFQCKQYMAESLVKHLKIA